MGHCASCHKSKSKILKLSDMGNERSPSHHRHSGGSPPQPVIAVYASIDYSDLQITVVWIDSSRSGATAYRVCVVDGDTIAHKLDVPRNPSRVIPAEFKNVKPGQYSIRVTSINDSGQQSPYVACVETIFVGEHSRTTLLQAILPAIPSFFSFLLDRRSQCNITDLKCEFNNVSNMHLNRVETALETILCEYDFLGDELRPTMDIIFDASCLTVPQSVYEPLIHRVHHLVTAVTIHNAAETNSVSSLRVLRCLPTFNLAVLDIRDRNYMTPMMVAAWRGHFDTVTQLLIWGCDTALPRVERRDRNIEIEPFCTNAHPFGPVPFAVVRGNADIQDLLPGPDDHELLAVEIYRDYRSRYPILKRLEIIKRPKETFQDKHHRIRRRNLDLAEKSPFDDLAPNEERTVLQTKTDVINGDQSRDLVDLILELPRLQYGSFTDWDVMTLSDYTLLHLTLLVFRMSVVVGPPESKSFDSDNPTYYLGLLNEHAKYVRSGGAQNVLRNDWLSNIAALFIFTSDTGICRYMGAALRQPDTKMYNFWIPLTTALLSAMRDLPKSVMYSVPEPHPTIQHISFRGIACSNRGIKVEQFIEGSTIQSPGIFVSTHSHHTAANHGWNGLILVVLSHKPTSIAYTSYCPAEFEVIHFPYSIFRVLRYFPPFPPDEDGNPFVRKQRSALNLLNYGTIAALEAATDSALVNYVGPLELAHAMCEQFPDLTTAMTSVTRNQLARMAVEKNVSSEKWYINAFINAYCKASNLDCAVTRHAWSASFQPNILRKIWNQPRDGFDEELKFFQRRSYHIAILEQLPTVQTTNTVLTRRNFDANLVHLGFDAFTNEDGGGDELVYDAPHHTVDSLMETTGN